MKNLLILISAFVNSLKFCTKLGKTYVSKILQQFLSFNKNFKINEIIEKM